MRALDLTAHWPVPNVSAAVVGRGEPLDGVGDLHRHFRLASISKTIAAWAMLVAVEEGVLALDTPIGQPGCTLRHLLSHAGGYPFNGETPIAAPEVSRIYSNTGIELAADAVAAAAGMPFEQYLDEAVFKPLGMRSTSLRGSPAYAMWSTVVDVGLFMIEVGRPALVAPATATEAARTHFPGLGGTIPGVGRFERSPWGLGFEVRGSKEPHWTGARNSESTFGHFGGAGTMMWIDPDADLGMVALTDRPFDEWGSTALQRWPEISDAVLDEFAGVGAQ